MKTTKITLLMVLELVASVAFAQDYTFKVLANKGSNELKAGTEWSPLKTGASLKSGDELKLSANAYIGLVHITGKPLELKEAGVYKVESLAAQLGSGSGVLNKYTDFILSSSSAEAKKNRLSATGAVNRGDSYAIKLMLPENQYAGIYNNMATVSWRGTEIAGPYSVSLRNMFDDELSQFDTPETSFQIDLTDPKFAKENAILIEVKSKSDPKQVSKQHLIKRLSPAEQAGIKKSLSEISSDVGEQTALGELYLARFYEDNNLLIDAISAYEEAIKLAPDVPFFRENYDEFLLRHNIK
ncbi:MAG: hypothetical protein OEV24_15395 [Cyclobacteriaceae bacterium]|jgi:hypothetical protein|nr:hypothetical protein [Cyclobacteriaceae bacterium]MDH5249645.1 hypothetical protein [Cyclobacteriaceae bacterium]